MVKGRLPTAKRYKGDYETIFESDRDSFRKRS